MVVVITGASSGIGAELAHRLSPRGAKLVLAARRTDKLEELNRELGGKHLCVSCDVSNPDDCRTLIARAIEKYSRIDTLVANAGYGKYTLTHEFTHDDVAKMFATNVYGTIDLLNAAVPFLARQSPRDGWRAQLMIVSSAAARRGVPYLGPYAATKAAQLSIAEAMRIELADQNIAVTSVHPVATKTEFGQQAESAGDIKMPRSVGAQQTVEHVVKKMIRAIEKPRPEIWPHTPTRYALALAAAMPRFADFMMKRFLRDIRSANAKKN